MKMDDRKHQLHDHLNATREAVLKIIGNMQPDDWNLQVQGDDGRWTVKQVMLHLATSETGQIATGRAIVAGQPTVPDDFDLNRYNNRQVEKNAAKTPPEILFGMAESRQKLLAFLDEVNEADLDKRGKHGRGDVISLEQLFYRIGEHEAEHTELIKKALGK
jgi:DinB superfamily